MRAEDRSAGLDLAGRRQDGSEFPIEVSLSYVNTINGPLIISVVNDITIRKQNEQIIRLRTEELSEANRILTSLSKDLQDKSHHLSERIKELTCLYQFSELIETPDIGVLVFSLSRSAKPSERNHQFLQAPY